MVTHRVALQIVEPEAAMARPGRPSEQRANPWSERRAPVGELA